MEPETSDGAGGAAAERDGAAAERDGAAAQRDGATTAWGDGASDLGILLAGLTGGAGLIHLVMVPEHAGGGSWIDPVGFAVVGWLQIALAVVFLLRRGTRALAVGTAVLNAAALGVWIWARTVGLPFGAHEGVVEDVGLIDGVCAGLEATAVVVALVMAAAPSRLRVGLLVPSIAAVAVLGLATVGITSPSTAEHAGGGHPHGDEATSGHDHGTAQVDAAAHDDQMAAIDAERCDLGFNPKSYWTEAATLGVDTYGGGSMDMSVAAGDITDVVGADEGRGSAGLDRLVAATSKADSGAEADAAGLVVALAEADDADYKAWRVWMAQRASTASGGHAHGSSGSAAAPDDNGGHGGHAGPTPWKAIVDQEQCVALAQELEKARDTALSLPTAADAMAAGYVRVTRYVPGIAAHYMKFPYVDGEFHIDQPEMVLYDGNEPEARVVGLSYYLIQPGDAEPTQGFTGDNDHYHRHVGLCTGKGGVIGDSSTTKEECAELGGVKADGSLGWMSHAWVVPGCESPWGVFSGASPLLDRALSDASGTNDGACSASSGRDRYDLSPGEKAPDDSGERASGD
jgi:hypothetical protein